MDIYLSCKVPSQRESQIQHMKLHHFSCKIKTANTFFLFLLLPENYKSQETTLWQEKVWQHVFLQGQTDIAFYQSKTSFIGNTFLFWMFRTHVQYTTNPTERSTSKIFRSMSEIVLEPSVEYHRALVERSTHMLGHYSTSARWDSTDDSKTISLVERKILLVECSVGLVV